MKLRKQTPSVAAIGILWLVAVSSAPAFYNPVVGKWLNRDPIGENGGKNTYAYVNNVPTSNFDLLGLKSNVEIREVTYFPSGYHASVELSRSVGDHPVYPYLDGGDDMINASHPIPLDHRVVKSSNAETRMYFQHDKTSFNSFAYGKTDPVGLTWPDTIQMIMSAHLKLNIKVCAIDCCDKVRANWNIRLAGAGRNVFANAHFSSAKNEALLRPGNSLVTDGGVEVKSVDDDGCTQVEVFLGINWRSTGVGVNAALAGVRGEFECNE